MSPISFYILVLLFSSLVLLSASPTYADEVVNPLTATKTFVVKIVNPLPMQLLWTKLQILLRKIIHNFFSPNPHYPNPTNSQI